MQRILRSLLFFVFLSAGSANAATIGFTLELSGGGNGPNLKLTNDSTAALLTDFVLTIGDTGYNFDALFNNVQPSGGTYTRNGLDGNTAGGLRSDFIDLDFTGFDPAEFYSGTAELDNDSGDSPSDDYETILFNNGAAPNSVATATFSDGTILSVTLEDQSAALDSHTFVAAVPVPAAVWLFGSALGLLGWMRRKQSV